MEQEKYNINNYVSDATGTSRSSMRDNKIVTEHFDVYEISIEVTPQNEFIRILEVKLNKDFLSQRQRMGSQSYLDVDKYYIE